MHHMLVILINHLHCPFGSTRFRAKPVLFILYVADLADIVDCHGVKLHVFADNTQLYLHCLCADVTVAATQLKMCITDISHSVSDNRLKMNTDKTELLWAKSRHSVSQFRVTVQPYSWAQTLFYRVTKSGCSESSFRLIGVLTDIGNGHSEMCTKTFTATSTKVTCVTLGL